jgi:hypothetical protein
MMEIYKFNMLCIKVNKLILEIQKWASISDTFGET